MIKKKFGFFLSISVALALLASCGEDIGASSTSPSESSSSSSSLPPSIDEDSFSYLKGTFVGKAGTLTMSKTSLSLTGSLNMELIPTAVSSIAPEISSSDGPVVAKAIKVVEFGSDFNPSTYRFYADLYGDGFLHLEEKVGEEYSNIATFMPDISYLGGSYSAYGDSSSYNFYEILDSNFDFEKGVYPASRYYPNYYSYSDSNSWYFVSRLRVNSNNINFNVDVTVQECDSDDYSVDDEGFVEEVLDEDKNVTGYNIVGTYGVINYADPGAFTGQTLFDGTSSISTSLDPDTKTFTFGDFSGSYVTRADEKGMRLDVSSSGLTRSFRIGDHYISETSNSETKVYPLDSIDELMGKFSKNGNTISIEEDDDWNIVVKLNDEAKEFSYITYNNRKSIKFTHDSKEYIVSPDLISTSVLVTIDEARSYFLNESKFLDLYKSSFTVHDETGDFSISVDENLKATKGNESANLYFSYSHGQRYPSLIGKLGDKDIKLQLIQPNIGFYNITIGEVTYNAFSKTILDLLYGTYSSNYKDRFVLDEEKLTIDSKVKTYALRAIYQSGTGTYNIGIEVDGVTYENNLNKCFVSDDASYVKLEVFDSIVGTYSQTAKYGKENIKYTSEGKLLLDTVNSDKTGLVEDVEYRYHIMTVADASSKAVIAFEYGKNELGETLYIYIYFYDNYVTIAGQNYYKYSIYSAWGTYSDEAISSVVYVQNDYIYFNGTNDYVSSWKEENGTLVATSSSRTYVFDANQVSVTSGEETITLYRKLTYTDFDSFVGEYTVNEKTFSFVKNEVVGYSLVDGTTTYGLTSIYITSNNGKLALTVSTISAKYVLSLDLTTKEVTASYEAGTLPPPPPPLPLK